MELKVTWGRAFRVWWGHFWRVLVATIPAYLAINFCSTVCVASGIPTRLAILIVVFVSSALGCAASLIPMKMILGKRHGNFRLALLSVNPEPQETLPAIAPKLG